MKKRHISLLAPNVMYCDGQSIHGIRKFLLAQKLTKYIVMTDMTMFDTQQDKNHIDFEMYYNRMLGADVEALNRWELVHGRWRWRSKNATGFQEAKRTSGQCTTGDGNAKINEEIHAHFAEIPEAMVWAALFGDDHMNGTDKLSAWKNFTKVCREVFNMNAKYHYIEEVGEFCKMIIFKDRELGKWNVCVNVVRLFDRSNVIGNNKKLEQMPDRYRAMHDASVAAYFDDVLGNVQEYMQGKFLLANAEYNKMSVNEIREIVRQLEEAGEQNTTFVQTLHIHRDK
jgi:hypothetical protein